jgi:transcriptional regulator of NAD metabolism
MRPEDWINAPLPFFPFLPDDAAVPVIVNKHTVIMVTLQCAEGTEGEALIGLERRVVIECGERRIEGLLHIDMPQNLQRLQDYLNRNELFVTLTDGPHHHLVQKHHITRVIEIREE